MSATRPPAFDDRFTTPIEASRRGAHRARPKPVSAGLPVIAGVAVVLLVLGGVYTLLSNRSTTSPDVSGAGLDDGTVATATKSGAAPAPASTTKAAGSAATPTNTTAPADTGSVAGVDKTITVVVLNSGSVKGLALRAGEALKGQGWTVTRTGNSIQKNLDTSKIYYAKSSQESTATALKADVGHGILVLDAQVAAKGLVVVLGHDAE
jgi:hypothetical protein